MSGEEASSGRVSVTVKAVAAVFATVIAPVLVALGMKIVDKVEIPTGGKNSSDAAVGGERPTADKSANDKPAGDKPAGNADPSGGAADGPPVSTVQLQEIPLQDGWVFHPLDAGTVDTKRFNFRSDGTLAVAGAGPRGLLLKPGDFDDFRVTLSWRCPVVGRNSKERVYSCGVLLRSGIEHWPENRIDTTFSMGRIGRFRWGKNVSLSAQLVEDHPSPIDGSWHAMEIECRGNSIEVKNDGAVVCTVTSVSRKSGRVGLTVLGRDMEYRDFRVERLASSKSSNPKSTGASTPADPPKPAVNALGKWRIQGTDSAKTHWTGDMTLVTKEKTSLSGHIDWSGKGGKLRGARGKEIISGEYNAATRTLTLHGETVEDGKKLNPSNYVGVISEDGTTMTLTGDDFPGKWLATRVDEPEKK